jgi:hypothetical protein
MDKLRELLGRFLSLWRLQLEPIPASVIEGHLLLLHVLEEVGFEAVDEQAVDEHGLGLLLFQTTVSLAATTRERTLPDHDGATKDQGSTSLNCLGLYIVRRT